MRKQIKECVNAKNQNQTWTCVQTSAHKQIYEDKNTQGWECTNLCSRGKHKTVQSTDDHVTT